MPTLFIKIINPEEIIFEGNASSLVAPGMQGLFGILPGHASMIAMLKKGHLKIETQEQTKNILVQGGFLEVSENTVTVLCT